MSFLSASTPNANRKMSPRTIECKPRSAYPPILWVASILIIAGVVACGLAESQPAKPAKGALQLEVYTADEESFGVTSTLIYGKTEAVLVDAQFLNTHAAL